MSEVYICGKCRRPALSRDDGAFLYLYCQGCDLITVVMAPPGHPLRRSLMASPIPPVFVEAFAPPPPVIEIPEGDGIYFKARNDWQQTIIQGGVPEVGAAGDS